MPPDLDVYVISSARDRETIERFIQTYVDRQSCEDRGDEELMMVPIGTEAAATKRWDWEPPSWDWEPAKTLSHVINRALDYPRRAFALYLPSRDPRVDSVVLSFTVDDKVVFGLSVDDATETDTNLQRAKGLVAELVGAFAGELGYVGWEMPAPLQSHLPEGERLLYAWKREAGGGAPRNAG